VFASGAVTAGGTVPMQACNNDTQRQNFFDQTDLTYDLATGALKDKLPAGVELGRRKTTDLRKNGTFQPGGTTLVGTPASSPTIFSPPATFANNGVSNADNTLGVIYQSEMFASISNAVVLPDFTRVDAAPYCTFSKAFSAQLNVVNLFDEEHCTAAHNDNNISPGTTRGAFVTLTASF
jgi:outer membrane receptor for monomeric catechols